MSFSKYSFSTNQYPYIYMWMHIEPFRIADDMSLVLYIYEYFDIVAVIAIHIGRSYPNGYLVLGIRNVVNRLLLVSINFYIPPLTQKDRIPLDYVRLDAIVIN